MKKIETTRQFDKDLKVLGLSAELIEVLHALINGLTVPEKYKDHALTGSLKKYHECHLKPDLLLAYQSTEDSIRLIAIDNHNNLFKSLSKF
ncbi:type II toxin-antitoxin system YafQ family toxin [Moraxella marmotae]|uniref:type II toxin-antitoxin system YafQ family toxin n=1 Tax=Moraxella marmotae TaxID=3344520 RepID=UPI0035F322DF